ncbi:glycosyltransferase family 39 protein, partial [bacterium]|nr:glycosyltransferase family 39 protein [bacterium]
MSWPWLGPVHPLAAWLFVAAVAVRIPGLSRSLWYDELFTQRRFLDSFVNAFGRQREANNHPLASVLAWAAGRLTGSEDKLVLRAPSVLLGALAILAVAWLAGRSGKRAFSWAAAGAAAVLALAHPTLVAYSQEVRGYAGLLLATPLVIGLTLSLLEERGETTWKRRGSLALAVGLGLFFHLTLGIVVAGLIAYSALAPGARWESRRRTLLTLGSGLALGVALYAPILRILSGFARKWTGLTEESPFDGGAPSLERLAKIGEMLSINDLRLLPGWVSPWVLGALLVLLVSAGAWSSFREKDHLALATASVVLTTAVAWTVARPLFFPRFFLFLLPP